jgi:hypothetical protein
MGNKYLSLNHPHFNSLPLVSWMPHLLAPGATPKRLSQREVETGTSIQNGHKARPPAASWNYLPAMQNDAVDLRICTETGLTPETYVGNPPVPA